MTNLGEGQIRPFWAGKGPSQMSLNVVLCLLKQWERGGEGRATS